jgi:hypothetical protein
MRNQSKMRLSRHRDFSGLSSSFSGNSRQSIAQKVFALSHDRVLSTQLNVDQRQAAFGQKHRLREAAANSRSVRVTFMSLACPLSKKVETAHIAWGQCRERS